MLEKILTLTPKHIHLINNIAYNSWVLVQTYAQICLLTTEEATPELEKLIETSLTDTYLPTEESLGVSLNIPPGLWLMYQAFESENMQSLPPAQRFCQYHQIVQANPPHDASIDSEPVRSSDQESVDSAAEEECKILCMAQQQGLFYFYDTELEDQQRQAEGGVPPSLPSADDVESAEVQKTEGSDAAMQSEPQETMSISTIPPIASTGESVASEMTVEMLHNTAVTVAEASPAPNKITSSFSRRAARSGVLLVHK
ncbi:hypothetical protein FIBSPDRAFT_905997, partial [Athelia psychrophila]